MESIQVGNITIAIIIIITMTINIIVILCNQLGIQHSVGSLGSSPDG